jgi:glycosyltransferase involved in cell wall biosynthesis
MGSSRIDASASRGNRAKRSVVIATRDRPKRLAACLESLAAQDYPRQRFEVIVVDDGGYSRLRRVATRYRERLRLSTLERPFAGRSAARNQGAARASGELVAFTDDDTEPEPGWLRALATRHAAAPGDALGGRTVSMSATNPYARVSSLILDLAYAHQSNRLPRGARFFAANNLALPADRFHMLGDSTRSFASPRTESSATGGSSTVSG